ncbi:uncharacterized protein LOC111310739 [Durio zibethinus]|uniref:Uncharacterized protein LOC111310739 n=1 Tax=Durio zibethinus TaxID=66656 RepID=A0A6P6AM05_DURZI|nr:uncharacterized protein LOC111310739 [Durio zibethinus]
MGEPGNDAKNRFWKTRLPSKIQIFGWKLNNGYLPVFSNQRRRGIEVSPVCLRCGKEDETVTHALWGCENAKAVWDCMSISNKWKLGAPRQHRGFLAMIAEEAGSDSLEMGLVAAWAIWHSQNIEVINGEKRGPKEMAKCVEEEVHWQPPPYGSFKVNFDGSFNAHGSGGCIGVAIRDHEGHCMGVIAAKMEDVCDPLVVEAIAALQSFKLAEDMRLPRVIIEETLHK